jgi:hypothetical protein
MMVKKTVMTSLLVAACAASANAAGVAVITRPPTLLSGVLMVGAVVCAVVAYQVHGLVRGGALSKSWRYFVVGFILLALSQLLSVLGALEVLSLPSFVGPALLVIMAGFFFLGVWETRRTLGS